MAANLTGLCQEARRGNATRTRCRLRPSTSRSTRGSDLRRAPRWHPVASDIARLLLWASLRNDALGVPMPPRALVTNARFRLRPSPGDPDSVIGVWDGHGIGEQDGK